MAAIENKYRASPVTFYSMFGGLYVSCDLAHPGFQVDSSLLFVSSFAWVCCSHGKG